MQVITINNNINILTPLRIKIINNNNGNNKNNNNKGSCSICN